MTESEAIRELEWARNRLMQTSHMDNNRTKAFNTAIKALEKVQQYEAIGTIERFRELTEKAEPKKPYYIYSDEPLCPYCQMILDDGDEYCECGQRLDWQ